MNRPNVLILYTDQQRWDTIRATGNPLIHTPNLDTLASGGAWFNMAFCNSPVCMPSRMSMLSGRYPASLGVRCNGIEMPVDVPCLQHILAPYGYRTANIGKLHFTNHASQFRDHREPHPTYGFHTLIHSDEPGCYDDAYIKWVEAHDPAMVSACRVNTPAAWTGNPVVVHPRGPHQPYLFEGPEELTHSAFVADETCRFIRSRASRAQAGEPFFCISGFYAPHAPINPPQRFVQLYDEQKMPLPHRNEGENFEGVSDEEWRKIKAYYYALISHIDDQIGQILLTLEECGLKDDTIVIFTSDHGENLGDHGKIAKGNPHDSASRVPLVVSYPTSFDPSGEWNQIIEAVDIAPTILDWCGVQTPPFMQGRSFRPLIEGRDYDARTSAFFEINVPLKGGFKGVRTERYLYSRTETGDEVLYDCESDPHQLRDVSADGSCVDLLHEARECLLARWYDTEKQYPKRTALY